MGAVLKFCLNTFLSCLCFFAGLVCLGGLIQLMDSCGIKKPIISALRRVYHVTYHIWSFLNNELGVLGCLVLILFLLGFLFADPLEWVLLFLMG